jgi:hypothetical protein
MVAPSFKKASDPDPGTSVIYGATDIVKIVEVLQGDKLSSWDFTLLFMRVPLENYYQCGFGGMGDRFDSIKPPSKLANISRI